MFSSKIISFVFIIDFKILYVHGRLVSFNENEHLNLESECISIWCQNSSVFQCESLKIFLHQRKSRSSMDAKCNPTL